MIFPFKACLHLERSTVFSFRLCQIQIQFSWASDVLEVHPPKIYFLVVPRSTGAMRSPGNRMALEDNQTRKHAKREKLFHYWPDLFLRCIDAACEQAESIHSCIDAPPNRLGGPWGPQMHKKYELLLKNTKNIKQIAKHRKNPKKTSRTNSKMCKKSKERVPRRAETKIISKQK